MSVLAEKPRVELLSLPQVAFAPPFPNPAETDEKGELAYVPIDELFIDPRYQRPVGTRGESNIRRIIENFSWALFSPIVVARRGPGRYAIIDGQHRAIAALTHGGIDMVPALIIKGDETDEAKAFAVINGAVTAILPQQIWHARVVAGDLNALALQRVLDATGVIILRSQKPSDQMRKGETASIDGIESAFKRYGKGAVTLALRSVVETRPDGNPGMLRTPLIKATCHVLVENPKIFVDPDGVITAIKKVGIGYLWKFAEDSRHKAVPKKTVFTAYAELLEKHLKKEMMK